VLASSPFPENRGAGSAWLVHFANFLTQTEDELAKWEWVHRFRMARLQLGLHRK
jgi:hypothetical protein